jgi:hypothetical protein
MHECSNKFILKDAIDQLSSLIEAEKEEKKSADGLFQCPYSKATRCNLKDCCLECETFGEFNQ